MLLEEFLKSETRRVKFLRAVDEIRDTGAQGLLLEMATHHTGLMASGTPGQMMHEAAAKSFFHDGYVQCISDIFMFRERFIQEEKVTRPPSDFAAAKELLKAGEIDQAEYDQLIRNVSDE